LESNKSRRSLRAAASKRKGKATPTGKGKPAPRTPRPPREPRVPRTPRPTEARRAERNAARAASREIAPGSAAARALPRVVIAGRPNAGKSSLFNRLLRRRKAVVDPTPGVTRDVNEAVAVFEDRAILLVDTGGFEGDERAARGDEGGGERLDRAVRDTSLGAVEGAALVLYVLDGKAGLSPADEAAAAELRRRRARVLFVVNKLDSAARLAGGHEFYRLGTDELIPVSAAHGHGIAELVERILAETPTVAVGQGDDAVRVAIVGRPNAGKSSLVNRLLGFERAIVDATAGTTRDALDTLLEVGGTRYVLVDTAGIRRRNKVHDPLERSSVGSAIDALNRADVAMLVIDAAQGLTTQDQKLAALAWNEGKGLVLVVNKWDLATVTPKAYLEEVTYAMPTLGGFPMLTVSALEGTGIDKILPTVKRVAAAHGIQMQTARLNQVVTAAVSAQEPPAVQGRRPRFYYAAQTGRRPPTVVVFASIPYGIHPSYHRYLTNQIAAAFNLKGTPLRLSFRARH
jgi:GTP-binding protein